MRRFVPLCFVWFVLAGCGDTPQVCDPCGTRAPRLLTIPQGIVPRSIQDMHATTAVRVRLLVDETGTPSNVEALDAVPVLDSVAVDAISRSTWAPAAVGTRAIAAVDTVTLFGCDSPSFGEFVYYEEEPVRISMPSPLYPDSAREAGIEGTVRVEALIGIDGSVWCTKVAVSVPGLDDAALDAIWRSRWQPAKNEGGPIAVWVEVPIAFILNVPPAVSRRANR